MTDDKFTEILRVDVEGGVGPDGKLTPEGLQRARSEMLQKLCARFPSAKLESLQKTVNELLAGAETFSARDLQIVMEVRSLVRVLRKAAAQLDGIPSSLVRVAQLVDKAARGGEPGPHIFGCGMASSDVSSAIMNLASAANGLENLLSCECFGGADPGPHGEGLN
jgi:hypothetical protein